MKFAEDTSGVRDVDAAKGFQQEVPSYVANRMLRRIAIFSGVPVFLGLCLLPVFYYLQVLPCIAAPPLQ